MARPTTGRDKAQKTAKTRDGAARSKRDVSLNKAQQKRQMPEKLDRKVVAKIDAALKDLAPKVAKLKDVEAKLKDLDARTLQIDDEDKRREAAAQAAKRSADLQNALMALLRKLELAHRELAAQQKAYQTVKVPEKLPPLPKQATVDALTIALVLGGMLAWWRVFKKKLV